MKIKVTVEYVIDSGDQTLEEAKEYLAKSSGFEALEWIPDDAKFTFEAAQ